MLHSSSRNFSVCVSFAKRLQVRVQKIEHPCVHACYWASLQWLETQSSKTFLSPSRGLRQQVGWEECKIDLPKPSQTLTKKAPKLENNAVEPPMLEEHASCSILLVIIIIILRSFWTDRLCPKKVGFIQLELILLHRKRSSGHQIRRNHWSADLRCSRLNFSRVSLQKATFTPTASETTEQHTFRCIQHHRPWEMREPTSLFKTVLKLPHLQINPCVIPKRETVSALHLNHLSGADDCFEATLKSRLWFLYAQAGMSANRKCHYKLTEYAFWRRGILQKAITHKHRIERTLDQTCSWCGAIEPAELAVWSCPALAMSSSSILSARLATSAVQPALVRQWFDLMLNYLDETELDRRL